MARRWMLHSCIKELGLGVSESGSVRRGCACWRAWNKDWLAVAFGEAFPHGSMRSEKHALQMPLKHCAELAPAGFLPIATLSVQDRLPGFQGRQETLTGAIWCGLFQWKLVPPTICFVFILAAGREFPHCSTSGSVYYLHFLLQPAVCDEKALPSSE